jgi:hypothetical protein
MMNLQEHLAGIPPGDVSDPSVLARLLAANWDEFEGSAEGGMQGYKLLGRIEQVSWQPPILSFVLERHGGTVMGSTRGELQDWEVDVDKQTAVLVKSRHRQLEKMAPRISIKVLAEEFAERILSGEDDERIKRLEDGSVKVVVSTIFPAGSGFQRTVSGRRKRLVEYVGQRFSHDGWVETIGKVFKPRHKPKTP